MPNTELAYRVLDHIDAHPEGWDQGTFYVHNEGGDSVTACFAGRAVLLSGHTVTEGWVIDGDAFLGFWALAVKELGVDGVKTQCTCVPGCPYLATAAGDLFAANNSREHLGKLVEQVFGPRP